jgi:hypothetical protein
MSWVHLYCLIYLESQLTYNESRPVQFFFADSVKTTTLCLQLLWLEIAV